MPDKLLRLVMLGSDIYDMNAYFILHLTALQYFHNSAIANIPRNADASFYVKK